MALPASAKVDRELYRQAYEAYRQWNEAELVERAWNAGRTLPQEAWRQYVALVELCWKLCPQQSEWQREQKLADVARDYERVEKLEAWRRARGKAT